MANHHTHTDFDLGQKICRELRSGNRSAILALYNRYQHFFAIFARKRLFDEAPSGVEEMLSNFWLELLNGKAICSYNGKASLRTYLTVILHRRIIDANRKFEHERKLTANNRETEVMGHSHDQYTPEKKLIIKEQQRLIQTAFVQLSDNFPRDAILIRMHLEGLSYEQMAQKELKAVADDPDELKRKVDAIKKQFTRKETGSMARFKSIINRCLNSDNLEYKDLIY